MDYILQIPAAETGEMLARRMLAAAVGRPADTLTLLRDNHGKPYLPDSNLSFNISHAADALLCAVHTAPVGVDIEPVSVYRDRVARRICSPAEYAYIGSDPTRFCEVWTRKEAYAKLTGKGLSYGLSRIPVADAQGLLPQINRCAVKTAQQDGYVYSLVWVIP